MPYIDKSGLTRWENPNDFNWNSFDFMRYAESFASRVSEGYDAWRLLPNLYKGPGEDLLFTTLDTSSDRAESIDLYARQAYRVFEDFVGELDRLKRKLDDLNNDIQFFEAQHGHKSILELDPISHARFILLSLNVKGIQNEYEDAVDAVVEKLNKADGYNLGEVASGAGWMAYGIGATIGAGAAAVGLDEKLAPVAERVLGLNPPSSKQGSGGAQGRTDMPSSEAPNYFPGVPGGKLLTGAVDGLTQESGSADPQSRDGDRGCEKMNASSHASKSAAIYDGVTWRNMSGSEFIHYGSKLLGSIGVVASFQSSYEAKYEERRDYWAQSGAGMTAREVSSEAQHDAAAYAVANAASSAVVGASTGSITGTAVGGVAGGGAGLVIGAVVGGVASWQFEDRAVIAGNPGGGDSTSTPDLFGDFAMETWRSVREVSSPYTQTYNEFLAPVDSNPRVPGGRDGYIQQNGKKSNWKYSR